MERIVIVKSLNFEFLRLEDDLLTNPGGLAEAADQHWSARALERQIGVLYYERLLASKDKQLVEHEAQAKTNELVENPKDYLRDPYILDFLNLQDKTYQESDLEQGIISNLQQFLLELGKGFAFFASKYLTELLSEEELKREREKVLRIQETRAQYKIQYVH